MEGSALLATSNATFNALTATLVVAAFVAIKRRRVETHRRLMLAALTTSSLFLVGYLTRMAIYGSKHFEGTGTLRTAYLALLASHTLLAALVVPMVLRTLYLALRRRFDAHRGIARFTLPVWFYVSTTGVVVYLMLYQR
jgi:putative membrane protein